MIDVRSDTVTRPSPQMRAAMAAAQVGDDVYGEDPTVNALEKDVAAMLGHEAGLFVPSGSLGNQLGVRLIVPAGQELLCDSQAHIVRAEMGAHAAIGGITTRTWHSDRGRLRAADPIAMAVAEAGPYIVSTAAIAVEDTHNFGGGTVQDLAEMRSLRVFADEHGIKLHLDGARLWNATVATGVEIRSISSLFDTVSVCLSKGLGAPVGSVLVSSTDRIAAARVWRKRLGAGMRQVGVLAAAGQYALQNNVARLAEDHANAKRIAELIAARAPQVVSPETVETNVVVLELPASSGPGLPSAQLAARARAKGILVSVLGPQTVRVVTHLDLSAEQAESAGAVLAELLG
ncbi:MAG: threonine aldolase family protein [Candidatus Nanopelagicales bacterium]